MSFIRLIRACSTCHRSWEVCPDCGVHLIHHHPDSKIICTECSGVASIIGHKTVGIDQDCEVAIIGCPTCSVQCTPALGPTLKERYVSTEEYNAYTIR